MTQTARLIVALPKRDSDLYYACRFTAPDPVIYLEHHGKKYLFLSPLEIGRGKSQAKVDQVLPIPAGHKTLTDRLVAILADRKIRSLSVPITMPCALVDSLRRKKIKITPGEHPFYPERFFKTAAEKKEMLKAQKAVFQAMRLAEQILSATQIRKKTLYWKEKILTSEELRYQISCLLLQQGYNPLDPIVACGAQSADPHDVGSGPLKAHQPIIVDIFPRSQTTLYYGDATRTFCRGKAPPALVRQYNAVKKAQEWALKNIRAEINGRTIHEGIHKIFREAGFPTGFIHGTGHGLGLELHEEPLRISGGDYILKAGHVVTVEPGLYYRPLGGVRIEDAVYVTKTGADILGYYPKRLEIL